MEKYIATLQDVYREKDYPGFYFGLPGRKDAFIITDRKRKNDALCLLIAKAFHFTDIASPAECIAYVKPFIEKASLRARDLTINGEVITSYSIRGRRFCSLGMTGDVIIMMERGN